MSHQKGGPMFSVEEIIEFLNALANYDHNQTEAHRFLRFLQDQDFQDLYAISARAQAAFNYEYRRRGYLHKSERK